MNKPQGILLVLSGPSGAGKGTICGRLLEKRDHMAYSVSCTTREPRKGEVDGKNYFFKTREEFEEMIKKWRPFGTCFRLWKLLRDPASVRA